MEGGACGLKTLFQFLSCLDERPFHVLLVIQLRRKITLLCVFILWSLILYLLYSFLKYKGEFIILFLPFVKETIFKVINLPLIITLIVSEPICNFVYKPDLMY